MRNFTILHLKHALFRNQHAKSTTETSKVSICTGKSSLDRGLVWIDYKNNNNLICGSFKQIQPRILPQTFCVHFFSSSQNKILFISAETLTIWNWVQRVWLANFENLLLVCVEYVLENLERWILNELRCWRS